ncbi:dna polymerase [Salix suchowensis]|nr:dna polymerase [Salix suchowensis]
MDAAASTGRRKVLRLKSLLAIPGGFAGPADLFPPTEELPDRLWDMLLKRCPDLEEITLCSFSSSARLLAFDRITAGRFPKLHTLTLGSFGYTSDFTISYPGSDTSTFSDFLANHDSLKHIRLSWNFKRWVSPETIPMHLPPTALSNLQTYIGIYQQLSELPHPDSIETVDLTCEPIYEIRLRDITAVVRLKALVLTQQARWPWTLNSKSAHWNATGVRETQGGGDGSKVNGRKERGVRGKIILITWYCVRLIAAESGNQYILLTTGTYCKMVPKSSRCHNKTVPKYLISKLEGDIIAEAELLAQLQMNWGENTNKTVSICTVFVNSPAWHESEGVDMTRGDAELQECSLANWREDADKTALIYTIFVDSAARNDSDGVDMSRGDPAILAEKTPIKRRRYIQSLCSRWLEVAVSW